MKRLRSISYSQDFITNFYNWFFSPDTPINTEIYFPELIGQDLTITTVDRSHMSKNANKFWGAVPVVIRGDVSGYLDLLYTIPWPNHASSDTYVATIKCVSQGLYFWQSVDGDNKQIKNIKVNSGYIPPSAIPEFLKSDTGKIYAPKDLDDITYTNSISSLWAAFNHWFFGDVSHTKYWPDLVHAKAQLYINIIRTKLSPDKDINNTITVLMQNVPVVDSLDANGSMILKYDLGTKGTFYASISVNANYGYDYTYLGNAYTVSYIAFKGFYIPQSSMSDFYTSKDGQPFAKMCCMNADSIDRDVWDNFCIPANMLGKGIDGRTSPNNTCDAFMMNVWCAKDNDVDYKKSCGCSQYQDIPDGTDQALYDYMNSSGLDYPKICIINGCMSGDAYKTSSMDNTKCKAVCANIIDAQGGQFANITINGVNMQISCGSDGKAEITQCSLDDDCGAGYACLDNICVKKIKCVTDKDCGDKYICTDGNCVPQPAKTCLNNTDCGDDFVCTNGKCVPYAPACDPNNPCPETYTCVNGICVKSSYICKTTQDCSQGKVCTDGKCVDPSPSSQCKTDSDCLSDEVCSGGNCVKKGPSGCAGGCQAGYICVSGACVPSTPPPSNSGNMYMIIGVVVGILLLIIVCIIIWKMFKSRKTK